MKLSFCIPVYNMGPFIGQTLESIVTQMTHEVEIVISNNASTDDTEAVVNSYRSKFPNITYFRWDENVGYDQNVRKVVELATGEYCWLMGADDALANGAVERLLSEIKYRCDIYLCNSLKCDVTLTAFSGRTWLAPHIQDSVYDSSQVEQLINYLSNAHTLGAVFSFISCIVFKRERWCQVPYDQVFVGTMYTHVFYLLSIMNKGCKIKYIRDALVLNRLHNDLLLRTLGRLKRFLLDLDGYRLLADTVLNEKPDIKHLFLKVMQHEHPWDRWARMLYRAQTTEEFTKIKEYMDYYDFSPWDKAKIIMLYYRIRYRKTFKSRVRKPIKKFIKRIAGIK